MGNLKNFIVDTVALVKYLQDDLPLPADKAFKSSEQGKSKLLVSEIVIGEFIYISLKGRLKVSDPKSMIMEFLISMSASGYMDFVGMDLDCWEEFLQSKIPELHDRLICAIAKSRDAAVITNDMDIMERGGIEVVWD
jgi:predicted nucleic acid-binding protein